jgi:nitrate reductase NapAB chaperone NapD
MALASLVISTKTNMTSEVAVGLTALGCSEQSFVGNKIIAVVEAPTLSDIGQVGEAAGRLEGVLAVSFAYADQGRNL